MADYIDTILNSRDSFFLTGAGGTGKTWTVKALEKTWKATGTCYAILTPTGVAAVNIGGQTIHSFFKIGLAQGEKEQLLSKCRKMGGHKNIFPLEIIVIDEISMVSAELFELIDYICREIRKCPEPFGGIRMIITGDFCQLKCISGSFAFTSKTWKQLNLKIISLTEPKRFNDMSYWKMLNRARLGKLKQKDIKRLQERQEAYKTFKEQKHETMEILPTILLSYKAEVEQLNNDKLKELQGEEYVYKAQDYTTRNCDDLLATMAPAVLRLKVGAQVMCTRNIDIEMGICNGTRGVVVSCTSDTVSVMFDNGLTDEFGYQTWEIENQTFTARRMQIPFILAYCLTIHKVQGCTISLAVLDLGSSIFSPAQAYVALSRVRNYASLYLSNFRPESIFADNKAIEFYEKMGINI
jgi:ATP-dependent DNA helicase PIF1